MAQFKGSVLNPWGGGGKTITEGYLNNGVLYATKSGSVYLNPITLVEGKYYLDKNENSVYRAVRKRVDSNVITFDGDFSKLEFCGNGMYLLTENIAETAAANIVGASFVSTHGNYGTVAVEQGPGVEGNVIYVYGRSGTKVYGEMFLFTAAYGSYKKGIYMRSDSLAPRYYLASVTSNLGPLCYDTEGVGLEKLTDTKKTSQYSTMPAASAEELGKIVQFIGTTDANYTNGYFYECVSDGAATPTYSWSRKNVQPSGA